MRLRGVPDQLGATQSLVLDHLNGQMPTLDGINATNLAITSPGVHVKNLGTADVWIRTDGPSAALNAPQCYPLGAGTEWDFWFNADGGTLSLFGAANTKLSVIPYKATLIG